MKPTFLLKSATGLLALALLGIFPAKASVVSPVQTSADPMGLPIAAPVQLAGSDAAAQAFQSSLPAIQAYVKATIPEYRAQSGAALSAMAVKFSDLYLTMDSSVRVYFLSEGASYRNSLGVNLLTGLNALPTSTTAKITSSAEWVFPDASSNDPTTFAPNGNSARTTSAPLSAGDFVNLGTGGAGTLLDFFLVSNGANGGSTAFTAESARNGDALQHMVALTYGNYLILSYEDATSGGDRDYNDVVFAVELTPNAQTPEPSTWAGMLILSGLVGYGQCRTWLKRRNAPLPA